jgi:hypothetical protein
MSSISATRWSAADHAASAPFVPALRLRFTMRKPA